ncbi:hypothetical protein HPB48_020470 [Haemaphysalis longicornis]|uniref:Uncharacterized protein n=1 Tax=Haemaphysalis longicornis TaxID=44386 RepID=A0A9J6GWX4_HAELO|nr:hypothetical protein HPB48_020470 [Haemaphysalis longicornis]
MALASAQARHILSDSKTAVSNFARVRTSAEALKIMNGYCGPRLRRVKLIRSSAHNALPSNEDADNLDRGLTDRFSVRRTMEQPSSRRACS